MGVIKDDWNGFNVLHTAAPGLAGSMSAPAALPGGKDTAAHPDGREAGEIDVLYLLGADEIDMSHAGRRLRHLSGHPWRCRRAPRRCHPAGAAYTEKSGT